MSGSIAKKLRAGIIDKLKEIDCYIDNDLPEYIMVLIANKKSSSQMKEDLSLFVGDNVSEFVDWLHNCLDEIKQGNDPFVKQEPKISICKAVSIDETDTIKRQDLDKKSNVTKSTESIKNEIPIRQNVRQHQEISFKQSASTKTSASSSEESKENAKDKPIRIRKEITFTNEDKIKFENDKIKTDSSKTTQQQHKRIVYNPEQEQKNDQPTKRFRNQIAIDKPSTSLSINHPESTNLHHNELPINRRRVSNLYSQVNYKQPNQRSPQSSNNYSESTSNYHSTNQQQNHHHNQNYTQTYLNNHINNQTSSHSINQNNHSKNINHVKSINQRSEIRNHLSPEQHQSNIHIQNVTIKKEMRIVSAAGRPKSMILKAMEDANKHSSLPLVSLRSTKDSDSPSKSLINRLGMSSISAVAEKQTNNNDANKIIQRDDREDARKERRLAKFNKQTTEYSKPNEIIATSTEKNDLKPDDLRFQLAKKRKLEESSTNDQNFAKKISPHRSSIVVAINSLKSNYKKEIDNDEELKELRSQIKPKEVLAENKKEENKKDNNRKKDEMNDINNLDSSVITKQKWLEKMKTVQATVDEQRNKLKLSGKDANTSTKKERCIYWPTCANQDCQYHHPKTLCLNFPGCKYGAACLNVHPNCKYDAHCMNPVCPYTHTTRKLINKSQPKIQSIIHSKINSKVQIMSTIQKIQPVRK